MHVHELCGAWMAHPFWRTNFSLTDPEDVVRIADSGIREVWIDISRGLDVEQPQAVAMSPREVDAEVDRALGAALDDAATAACPPARAEFASEVERAARICARAKAAVVSMFQEVRMGKAFGADQVLPLVQEISDSVNRNPAALISLARLKGIDDYTYMHSVAVCALMISLSRQLGLDEESTHQAGLAGLLHDLGKALIPTEILNKPAKLTDAEFARVKQHPELGHRLLVEGGGAGPLPLDVCLHHHEKIDGTGYPHGLKADEISLYAKMGAVCDVYDAVTSNRLYKGGWQPAEAIRKMAEWSSHHFDERIFHAFVKSVGIYPVGSLVRMESGRLALVVEQNDGALLMPKVKAFFSIATGLRIAPVLIDLARNPGRDRILQREDPELWGLTHLDDMLPGHVPYR
ncbi:MAG: HD-GYP domain-containing protein [Gemmatimonadota bacterium]